MRVSEEYYQTAQSFDKWEKEQSDYKNRCLAIAKKTINAFGWYNYDIPFTKTDEDGNDVAGTYKVWQFFANSYCLEHDLDYTDHKDVEERTRNIDKLKKKSLHYKESFYDKINAFVLKLSEEYDVSVFLCPNNPDWNTDSLFFHYFQKSKWEKLPKTIDITDPVTDAIIHGEDVDHDHYPKLKNRHIVIVEMQTDNSHLKEVCRKIIEANKENKPLITYISLLKGFDRDEMQELIDQEKKKNEEAEAEKKGGLLKYKSEKAQIIRILQDNEVQCLYHFTDYLNLKSIRRLGGLYSWWSMKQKGLTIPCPGGGELSRSLDSQRNLEDYVRLSFTRNHPMMYAAKSEGRIETPCILKIKIDAAALRGTKYSNKNATIKREPVNVGDTLDDLKQIHFETVLQSNHFNLEDDEISFYQAEVLVKSFLPAEYIINLDSPLFV